MTEHCYKSRDDLVYVRISNLPRDATTGCILEALNCNEWEPFASRVVQVHWAVIKYDPSVFSCSESCNGCIDPVGNLTGNEPATFEPVTCWHFDTVFIEYQSFDAANATLSFVTSMIKAESMNFGFSSTALFASLARQTDLNIALALTLKAFTFFFNEAAAMDNDSSIVLNTMASSSSERQLSTAVSGGASPFRDLFEASIEDGDEKSSYTEPLTVERDTMSIYDSLSSAFNSMQLRPQSFLIDFIYHDETDEELKEENRPFSLSLYEEKVLAELIRGFPVASLTLL
ncbi:hypothetical protein HDU67_010060 [Dinochytrium kinnereticum]|nr:hypothetical protein HDU67_010060 [Dinochytrium kinnereticum]